MQFLFNEILKKSLIHCIVQGDIKKFFKADLSLSFSGRGCIYVIKGLIAIACVLSMLPRNFIVVYL